MAKTNWGDVAAQALLSAIPAIEQSRTISRQRDAAMQGMLAQEQHQRRADQRVMQELQARAASNPEQQRAEANEGYAQAIARARANAGAPGTPGASRRYNEDAAAVEGENAGFARHIAGLLSSIDAPARQRELEAQSQQRAGVDLDRIRRDSAADDWLMRFRQQNRTANPWAPLISALGSAALQGRSGGRGGDENEAATQLQPIELDPQIVRRRAPRPSVWDQLAPMPKFNPFGG